MKMKKGIAFIAAAALAAGVLTGIPAEEGFTGGIAIEASAASKDFVIETKDGKNYLTEYKGTGGDITIPAEVDFVDSGVFKSNQNIKSVTFPKTANYPTDSAYVSKNAFADCRYLKKVVFEGTTVVGAGAFNSCVNLETVDFKGGVTNYIGDSAFISCERLKTVKIADSGKDFIIYKNAFFGCLSLSSITIPSSCTEITTMAFVNCFALEKVTIPANTAITGDYTFGFCSMYKTEKDCDNYLLQSGDSEYMFFYGDGRTSAYYFTYSTVAGTEYDLHLGNENFYAGSKKYTPKKLTLNVAKGSSAETWAKEYKLPYTTYSGNAAASADKTTSANTSSEKLSAPDGIKASRKANSVTLSWNEVSGADGYRVYLYNAESGKYEKYKDVKNTKCTVEDLEKNTKYKFKVAALVKKDGKYTAQTASKTVSVTTSK